MRTLAFVFTALSICAPTTSYASAETGEQFLEASGAAERLSDGKDPKSNEDITGAIFMYWLHIRISRWPVRHHSGHQGDAGYLPALKWHNQRPSDTYLLEVSARESGKASRFRPNVSCHFSQERISVQVMPNDIHRFGD